jgi:triacylglycerol lipase
MSSRLPCPIRACRRALAAILLGICQHVHAVNNDPIVLVYGFLGFTDDQFASSGFKYWGGFDNIARHLRANGKHQVFTSAVGPISSSWDRAAELYYQIKGGCVDYGQRHTARYARFGALQRPTGKCWAADPHNNPQRYPLALYPQWDADHPIHLIGHSQGGQTIRALIQLLERGSPNGDEGGGELYQGGRVGWVRSATTISAPHDGTTLRDAVGDFFPAMAGLRAGVATLAGAKRQASRHEALGLEQFGVRRRPAESAAAFSQRASEAAFWDQENFDSAQYEMGPDGAQQFNAWVKTSPSVYYFSIANSATEQGRFCCNETDRVIAPIQNPAYQYPRHDMAPLTKPYAGEWIIPSQWRHGLGAYTQNAPGRVPIDSAWFQNDGVVNTVSMRAPKGQPVRNYDGAPVKGVWNFLGTYHGIDHFDIIGWPSKGERIYPLYDRIADMLYRL